MEFAKRDTSSNFSRDSSKQDFDQQTENEKIFNLPDYCAKFGTANPNLELIVSSDANNTLHITMEETFYGPEPEPEILETVTVNENVFRVM